MTTELKSAMASGVFVEFLDNAGNCLGHEVFTDWNGRPVPAVGDLFCCPVFFAATGKMRRMCGCVRTRRFETQRESNGETCVWVKLTLEAVPSGSRRDFSMQTSRSPLRFSRN